MQACMSLTFQQSLTAAWSTAGDALQTIDVGSIFCVCRSSRHELAITGPSAADCWQHAGQLPLLPPPPPPLPTVALTSFCRRRAVCPCTALMNDAGLPSHDCETIEPTFSMYTEDVPVLTVPLAHRVCNSLAIAAGVKNAHAGHQLECVNVAVVQTPIYSRFNMQETWHY